MVLKNFDELRNDMTLEKGFVAADVEAFVSASTIPLVQEFSQVSRSLSPSLSLSLPVCRSLPSCPPYGLARFK